LDGVDGSSIAWGDYDNDGDLDILLTGKTDSALISKLYRNDAGTFEDIHAGLPGIKSGSAAWGDYDNDGDLDILLTGHTVSAPITKVYRNDGGTFVDIGAGLKAAYFSSGAWGDYDNDGDLDILLTGAIEISTIPFFDYIAKVYRNDAGAFVDIGAGLESVDNGSVAWGDYDNDGDLDILLTGWNSRVSIARVYRNDAGIFTDIGADLGREAVAGGPAIWGDYDNDGDLDILRDDSSSFINVYRNDAGTFVDAGSILEGVYSSSVAWGDYDNDGDLDILVTGQEYRHGYHNISKVYRNDAGAFVDIGAGLGCAQRSSAAWGDFDNDGDLDILLTGYTSFGLISKVYRNLTSTANTPPSAPTNLSVHLSGSAATFSWDPATDAETPSAGLTYNLRVGTTPGGDEICSAMASPTGYRLIPAMGNTNHYTSCPLTLPQPFTPPYYWSVQAVDGAFVGSAFASKISANQVAGVPGQEDTIPTAFAIHSNAPNPFNPRTTISYDLPRDARVRLGVYDIAGRLVRMLVTGQQIAAGRRQAVWDGRDGTGRAVASGVYFCRLEAGDYRATVRMTLVK